MQNERKASGQGGSAQFYALAIEDIIREANSCSRGGAYGRADSDVIRVKPFETIEEDLLDRYPEPASQGYREAMRFLGEYDSLKGQSIDELLQDDASTDEFKRFIEGFRLLL